MKENKGSYSNKYCPLCELSDLSTLPEHENFSNSYLNLSCLETHRTMQQIVTNMNVNFSFYVNERQKLYFHDVF